MTTPKSAWLGTCLLALLVGCTGTIGESAGAPLPPVLCTPGATPSDSVPCLPTGSASACEEPATTGVSELQRLSSWQLENALVDLFGAEAVEAVGEQTANLPQENVGDAFQVFDRFVSSQLQETMIDVGLGIADRAVTDESLRARVFGSCASDSECLENYLETFATRVFRRPLTDSEKERSRQVLSRAADPAEGLADVLASHLASPHFLVHWELGEAERAPALLELTPYEIAARLSFGLADSPPDESLLALAESGAILESNVQEAEASRWLDSERGRSKVTALVFLWLDLERSIDLSTLPEEVVGDLDVRGLGDAAIAETERFIEHVIFEQNGRFEDLLTSHASFADHPTLAEIYGHAPAAGDEPQTMPDERHGILHRLPFLFSPRARTNLIERGVKVRRNVFCNSMPTPDLEVINRRDERPLTEDEQVSLDHLSLVEHETDETLCMTCHAMINPTGGSFEDFDSLGRLRDTEFTFYSDGRPGEEVPIRTAGDVPVGMDETLAVSRSSDLIEYLASSESAAACFSLRVFEQSQRRLTDVRDACALETALNAMVESSGTVRAGIVRFFVHNATGLRRQSTATTTESTEGTNNE